MTKQIIITDEQMRNIKTALKWQREAQQEYLSDGNKEVANFCEGQADGIEYVMNVLGIEF